jgi:hypothetical protein
MRNITLRSSYKILSASEVQSMPNVSIRKTDRRVEGAKDAYGFYGHSTIKHDYSLKAVSGDVVVIDNATGLMWHQSGSDAWMEWSEAKEWVEDLNSEEGYAGYNDWRLPTADEAVSLLESSEKNGDLYIDRVFSKKQRYIWTGDKFEKKDGSEAAWIVGFDFGGVIWYGIDDSSSCFVRPVRSVE